MFLYSLCRVLLRLSHSDNADLNRIAIDNNDANENDSCYYLGPGEGYWLRCAVLLLRRYKKESK